MNIFKEERELITRGCYFDELDIILGFEVTRYFDPVIFQI